jgi:cytochrome c oxidase accessory protein FixG
MSTFRDEIGVLDKKGETVWIYPKKPNGRFYTLRTWVSVILLGFLFSMPFLRLNDEQFLLFNVLERKFIIFGTVFSPQDFYLLAIAVLTLVLFIVLFTVAYGRVFCGWVCPQTIFMEMIFRKIEYLIEGDANQQRQLDAEPWTAEKIIKKTAKHFLFALISFAIANTFLAYLIGSDSLWLMIKETPLVHWKPFLSLIVFTAVFYIVFARMRELVCIVICPYGRLQGLMLDNNSIVVAYDFIRGEPRGKIKKAKNEPKTEEKTAEVSIEDVIKIPRLGDCVDCSLCVKVCPTGIDIRNGTQLECVNCTACIDACDEVMDKVKRPRGLIRYDSINGIKNKEKLKFTPRLMGYTAVLTLMIGILGVMLFNRNDFSASVLRTPGKIFQELDSQHVANMYKLEYMNKSQEDAQISLQVEDPNYRVQMIGSDSLVAVPKQGDFTTNFFIILNRKNITKGNVKIKVRLLRNEKIVKTFETTFLSPARSN